jgi:hypothetical protein
MKSVFSLIAQHQPKLFKVSYSSEYKNLIINYIATDPSHPLHETQKRRQAERKKEGLWWHATTGVDLSKSSVVRAWARRRLRNAIKEELKQRGYDEAGKFVNLKAVQDNLGLMNVVRAGKTLDLRGSLRLHVQSALIPAKYADVCAETGHVIEAMVQAIKNDASGYAPARRPTTRPSWTPPAGAKRPQPRVKIHPSSAQKNSRKSM